MPQTRNSRAYDYEGQRGLAGRLIHGATWALHCDACPRWVYPNIVDLIERYGDAFDRRIIQNAACRDCGGKLQHTGGMHVYRLQASGEMHTLVVVDGSSWRLRRWPT